MNVSLAMQVVSFSVSSMIRATTKDNEIELYLNNKEIYNHLADLCEKQHLQHALGLPVN